MFSKSKIKKILLFATDVLGLLLGYAVGMFVINRLEYSETMIRTENLLFLGLGICLYLICFVILDMYRIMLKRICFEDMFKCVVANAGAAGILVILNVILRGTYSWSFSFRVLVVMIAIEFVCTVAVRALPRTYAMFGEIREAKHYGDPRKRIIIYGAGNAGISLMNDLSRNPQKGYEIVGFLDDDPAKIGGKINNIRIYSGTEASIVEQAKRLKADTIIVAVPSASNERRSEMILHCKASKCSIKTLPALYDMVVSEEVSFNQVRDVDINDILQRNENCLDIEKVSAYLKGETILVTGAGGSIGSEICRQILRFEPAKLVLFDIYENNVYDLVNDLKREYGKDLPLETYIGSVRDYERLDTIFTREKPAVVFHAAAHKHVPLMEDSPGEAVKNNVFGTYNVVRVCDAHKVRTFVLISTDKAVNPTNVMGTTKRMAEMIVQSFAARSETKYVAVRFGNVLGSNGSVVPLFKKQIAKMGPVTVTDPEVTRFFMTIPEASRLVIQAGAMAKGGEIFILDMGKPVKIADLARNMIRLSGYTPDVDIKIQYVGLRPGEKLYEELLQTVEETTKTEHDGILIAQPIDIDWTRVEEMLKDFAHVLAANDDSMVIELLKKYVPTYHPEQTRSKKEYC